MIQPQISTVLSEKCPDCGEDLVGYLARELKDILQVRFQEAAKAALSALSQSVSVDRQRKKHANLQEKIQGLWSTSKLFEKALTHFEDSDDVSKYLLRTLCSDLTNMVLLSLAEDSGLAVPEDHNLSTTDRVQLISNVPVQMKKYLTIVNGSLGGKDTGTFFEAFESLCGQTFCGIMLKKVDRKKERFADICYLVLKNRLLLYSHQQSLLTNLKDEMDPAMALHLTSVLLFQQCTGCIIHVPGKLVPQVINFLESRMNSEEYSTVTQFQKLVALQWKASGGSKPVSVKVTEDLGAEASLSDTSSIESSVNMAGDSKAADASHVTSSDVDQQLKNMIGELKGLVIKPRQTAVPNN